MKDASLLDAAALPSDWATTRLRFRASINDAKLPEYTAPDRPLRYIDISSVHGDGSKQESRRMLFEDAPSRARRLARAGDTAISTVRTYLKAITYIDEDYAECVWSTGFAIVSPGSELDSRFLYYVARSKWFVAEIQRRSVGVSYPAINAEDIGDILCPVPLLEEQRRIADFLDDETARLEAIKRYRAYVASLASERVDATTLERVVPASARWRAGDDLDDVSLVTSIEGWTPVRLKHTVEGTQSGVWGDEPEDTGDDVYCIRVADFAYRQGRVGAVGTLRSIPKYGRASKLLAPGDLLLEKSGGGDQQPVGRVVIWDRNLDRPAVCSNFIARMRPRRGFDGAYLQLLHRALYFCGITALSVKQTTGIQNLDTNHYLGRMVSIPYLSGQVRLREELEELVQSERAIADRSSRQARLLDEHRDAVITAAVTGQLDPTSYRASALTT